ncbi:MAG: TIGR03761 family integrating conjugative element protein [Gammaproteobacteria bacterium]|nr:TIGR03761 family integrating conjugative element protein [Gammaproteobacteria bacterium]
MPSNSTKKEALKRKGRSGIGHYTHETEVFLDSRHALRLVGGRKADPDASESWAKHEVIGLDKYGIAAIRLYKMAYEDNPYVDAALINLEARIEEAESYYAEKISKLEGFLSSTPSNIEIKLVKSSNPFRLRRNFGGNPYANKGVLLVASYDRLMVLMETCRSYALIKRKESNDIEYHGGRKLRRIFVLPGEFVPCEVTRDDLKQNNERAQAVLQDRGKPNEQIVRKTVVPEFGPRKDDFDAEEVDGVLTALESLG